MLCKDPHGHSHPLIREEVVGAGRARAGARRVSRSKEKWWQMVAKWLRCPRGVFLAAWKRALAIMAKLWIQWQENPTRPQNERIWATVVGGCQSRSEVRVLDSGLS